MNGPAGQAPCSESVGHTACAGHGGGHLTWTCQKCDETTYGPPLNTHCTDILDGPAAVRISTAKAIDPGGTNEESLEKTVRPGSSGGRGSQNRGKLQKSQCQKGADDKPEATAQTTDSPSCPKDGPGPFPEFAGDHLVRHVLPMASACRGSRSHDGHSLHSQYWQGRSVSWRVASERRHRPHPGCGPQRRRSRHRRSRHGRSCFRGLVLGVLRHARTGRHLGRRWDVRHEDSTPRIATVGAAGDSAYAWNGMDTTTIEISTQAKRGGAPPRQGAGCSGWPPGISEPLGASMQVHRGPKNPSSRPRKPLRDRPSAGRLQRKEPTINRVSFARNRSIPKNCA
jgi:hypothetical protein